MEQLWADRCRVLAVALVSELTASEPCVRVEVELQYLESRLGIWGRLGWKEFAAEVAATVQERLKDGGKP